MLGRHLAERVILVIPVLLLATAMIFAMVHLAPGDPVTVLAGDQVVDDEMLATLRRKYNLDQPLPVQYARWLGNALRGDLGYSFATRQPVSSAIVDRLAVTAQLTLFALAIALVVAIPLGIGAAIYRRSVLDYLNQLFAMLGGSMPAFWIGILLILLFSVRLGWLPPSGYIPLTEDPLGCLRQLLLPAVTLSVGFAAVLSRVVRASMLDVLQEDYIRTARAKGLAERTILIAHAFRSALLPVITIIGMEGGHLLAGAVITETIFALPGMGRLLVDAVSSRDFPIVQAATLVLVLALVISNLLADIAYGLADPRVQKA